MLSVGIKLMITFKVASTSRLCLFVSCVVLCELQCAMIQDYSERYIFFIPVSLKVSFPSVLKASQSVIVPWSESSEREILQQSHPASQLRDRSSSYTQLLCILLYNKISKA